MAVCILAVLKRTIIIPPTGEPPYVDQETEVLRFTDGAPLTTALSVAQEKYPNALSFEIYRPKTDPLVQTRY